MRSPQQKPTAKKRASGNKKAAPEKPKLVTVKPSGRKEETFFELVFEVVKQIPKGRVTSYGAIAACLGARSSSRMVGWALHGAGRIKGRVPAHRVVNRIGLLSGSHHFQPPGRMQALLEKEGVKIKDNKVVDFKNLFWDPSEALSR